MSLNRISSMSKQGGMLLIEALIGILIFSFGVLAVVALQAKSIEAQSDAQYRTEAANYANQLLGMINTGVNRTNDATLQASLAAYAHHPTGDSCSAFTGGASTDPTVTAWLTRVSALPGATAAKQQIKVTTGTYNQIRITICWQGPTDAQMRRHQIMSYIN